MAAYIVNGKRVATGRFNGSLSSVSSVELGAAVIRKLISNSIGADDVDEVIMGNVLQAGLGQNPARQAAISAGLPDHVPAYTVNMVCASGLKSVALAAQAIDCGAADVVVAGGMEHMTSAPYLLRNARWGKRLGHGEMVDSMVCDALWDSFYDCHMGVTAENVASKYGISRREQDEYAALSQQKTEEALAVGKFSEEIVPVTVPQRRGQDVIFDRDEHPRMNTTAESLGKLTPAFKEDGTVTAGNASGINDGAGGVVVVSEQKLGTIEPHWAFKILASQSVGLSPAYMGLGPIAASRGALAKAGCAVEDLDLIEVNEAFAATSIEVNREMGWDPDKVNVLGGAIALGHPVGASGTRILVTLLHEMVRRNVSLGLASLCIGGGQGMAMVVERVA